MAVDCTQDTLPIDQTYEMELPMGNFLRHHRHLTIRLDRLAVGQILLFYLLCDAQKIQILKSNDFLLRGGNNASIAVQ